MQDDFRNSDSSPGARGLVWLDSAVAAQDGAVSIVAAYPEGWLRGTLAESAELAAAVEADPLLLLGAVDYDGAFCLGRYRDALVYHHGTGRWEARGNPVEHWGLPGGLLESGTAPGEIVAALAGASPGGAAPQLAFAPELAPERFHAMVQRAQEYIAAGDIYQVNLSHRFSAQLPAGTAAEDALALYRRLRAVSPAPMAAYLELGDGRFVLSASMEMFLRLGADGAVTTCPIKGTRPRFPEDPERDALSRQELRASPKERAELVMITDLERNDLGQVCAYGSIQVPRFLEIEAYAQVFHQVSEVRGQLRAGLTPLEVLRACFPGGSITGAPKKRAMEIIAELEPAPRGVYTGAIGYFGDLGPGLVSQWNIAIRTMVLEPGAGRAHFHAGAGIVADSNPAAEYEETLHKASGLLRAATEQA